MLRGNKMAYGVSLTKRTQFLSPDMSSKAYKNGSKFSVLT